MMKPEVYTEKGQQAQKRAEAIMQSIADDNNFYISWIVDHQDTDRRRLSFDGFISQDNKAICLFEARTRNATIVDDLMIYKGKPYDTIIVSNTKLLECSKHCHAFDLPMLFFVIFDNATLRFNIFDRYGNLNFPIDTKVTTTQANINGGNRTQLNAFLPIIQAEQLNYC